ncbi:MAG: PA2779 family protein [Pseudomonadales bacterium]|jgi:hypothetical protein|nr:PA2779 family protein [Pseudomonadales bacterium]
MQRLFLNLIILTLLTGAFASNASAQFITTDDALAMEQQTQAGERISSFLAREEVQQQLIKFGVPTEQAEQRIAALTPQELLLLDAKIGDMPAGAGGIAEVIGIVVIVLFILELLGVTDVFTAI